MMLLKCSPASLVISWTRMHSSGAKWGLEKVFWFLGFSGVGVGIGNNILEVNLKIYSGGKNLKQGWNRQMWLDYGHELQARWWSSSEPPRAKVTEVSDGIMKCLLIASLCLRITGSEWKTEHGQKNPGLQMNKVYTLSAEKLLVQCNFWNETAARPRGKNV